MSAQEPDTKPGPYYVSVIRDGGWDKFALVSGPYADHRAALDKVDPARRICEEVDPRACWYAFGTVRMAEDCARVGRLQQIGYDLDLRK